MLFENRHAGCEEREKINRGRIYDTLRINLFEATKQTARATLTRSIVDG